MGARGFRWRPAHDPGGAANLVRVSGDDGKYRAGRGLLSIVVHYGRSGWQVPGGPTSVKRHWASGELLAVPTHFERRTFWQQLGFRFEGRSRRGFVSSGPFHTVHIAARVPYWAVVLGTAALPGSVIIWRLRAAANPIRRGLCPRCGYDLRATPNKCPECGVSAAPDKKAAITAAAPAKT